MIIDFKIFYHFSVVKENWSVNLFGYTGRNFVDKITRAATTNTFKPSGSKLTRRTLIYVINLDNDIIWI